MLDNDILSLRVPEDRIIVQDEVFINNNPRSCFSCGRGIKLHKLHIFKGEPKLIGEGVTITRYPGGVISLQINLRETARRQYKAGSKKCLQVSIAGQSRSPCNSAAFRLEQLGDEYLVRKTNSDFPGVSS